MVGHDGKFMNIPSIRLATLVEQVGQLSDELALQHSSSVFRDEYDVIHEAVERMAAPPEYRLGHPFIVSQWAEGILLIPRAKARGLRLRGCQLAC